MKAIFYALLLIFLLSSSGSGIISVNEAFISGSIILPNVLKDRNLIRNTILEDINGNSLKDIVIFFNDKIYIFEQENKGGFSKYTELSLNDISAIDVGNVINGNEKELLIMNENGISCLKKENGEWNYLDEALVEKKTIYRNRFRLQREYFAIDLDGDEISELILWDESSLNIYRRNSSYKYKLIQSIPYETKNYFISPGLIITNSPWNIKDLNPAERFLEKMWPNNIKYALVSNTKIFQRCLFWDFNKDSRKDFILIQPTEKKIPQKGIITVFEYKIYLFNDDNKFSISPDFTIYDPQGAWISPNCTDINNDGLLDFIKIETEIKTGLRKHQKSTFSIFIAKNDGSYSNKPNQSIETTSLPLLHNLLVDIDGDKMKDLILIDPIIKGFSIGSIINKFLRRGIDVKVLVLPFNEGYSKRIMLKKVKMKFLKGIPINVEGDFNGDGKKDLLIVDEDTIKIFPLINLDNGFQSKPEFNIKIQNLDSYIVQDMNNNKKSDLIIFSGGEIKYILF